MTAGRTATETETTAASPTRGSSRPAPARAAEYALRSRGLTERSFRRIVVLLVALVVVPTFLLLGLGVMLLFLGELNANLLMGILVMALSGAAATGVILVWVFVTREANLSQLQTDFVSKVSHELRTPLTSIRLFSETLALRRGDAAAEDKCIQGLARESTRLQALIDRLLDWGRMESGRREYTMQETDVKAIVEDAVAAFEPIRERRGAELRVVLPEQLPRIVADRGALGDALVNLLTNAQKYGGDVAKIVLSVVANDRAVRIAVKDNGQGIEAVEHKRIFQKFYRVDDRLSREREGSGLGLAIVKHVMKAHRGRIDVESNVGDGSTFTLVLPLR
ncbi:MAG TPA: ATP-binding protein [Polyangiaceae bacterium]|jgi:two-component system phosphate regulon sensor histidine kinase PhoR|nr:ATP-binding protein [Polyangiaceae bacterium]